MDATTPPPNDGPAGGNRPRWRLPAGRLRPMLAVAVATLPDEPGWTFEPKWDGYRGIGAIGDGEVRIRSRRGTDMASWFPSWPASPTSSATNERWSTES